MMPKARAGRWRLFLTRASSGLTIATLSFASATAAASLAPTPPMGWSTWYGLRCDFDEAAVRQMADRLVSTKLAAAGYDRVNIDDCWVTRRDAHGSLIADLQRFPSGIGALGDYIHGKGLRYGLYTGAGTTTCQRELQRDASRLAIGSRSREAPDVRQFAQWGADFVKVDWCGHYETQDSRSSYETFHDAIAASGRPMLLSICDWGSCKPWIWVRGVGEMWRIAMNTQNCWACQTDWGGIGVAQTFDRLAELASAGGANGWNDPDNLMIGNGVLSPAEQRAQISVYAIAAAPLIISGDLRTIRRDALATLANRDVIAIDQDSLGKPGQRIRSEDGEEVWSPELSAGRRAVLLFNRSSQPRNVALPWTELDLAPSTRLGGGHEAWTGRRIAEGGGVAQRLAPHDVALFLLDAPSGGGGVRPPL